MGGETARRVTIRSEHVGQDRRFLWAYLDDAGNLHIDGQDLGPGTGPVSPDGEYEWFQTIDAVDVPLVVELLGGQPGTDVLEILKANWSGSRSYDLERTLRASGIDINRSVY